MILSKNTVTFTPGKLYKSMRRIYTTMLTNNIEEHDVFMLISSEKINSVYGEFPMNSTLTHFTVETNNGRREFSINCEYNLDNYIIEL